MPLTHDYSDAFACLKRLLSVLEEARVKAGRINLPGALPPDHIQAQIDLLEDLVAEARFEIAAARAACERERRPELSIVSD